MEMSTILILILIGIVAGFFGGLIGLGGGLIMIPALIYFLHLSQHEAQGTSLAVMLPPVGIMAVYNYYKAGALNMKYALIIAAFFIVGGYFGSAIAVKIQPGFLKKIFGAFIIIMGIKMLLEK